MDKEISNFIRAIDAKEPASGTKDAVLFKSIFKRSNYFIKDGNFIIVKISRSIKPFFGVGKHFIDLLNKFNYLLVLLVSDYEGWVYDKEAVNRNISGGRWVLSDKDNQYKINHYSLKECYWFKNVKGFYDITRHNDDE